MPLAAGANFAGYTIVRLLGTGGMGQVYLARHPRLPREDALKILNASITADPAYRQRFEREADLVAGLWHPHIVGVHDRGETDGQLWITMDYVDGTDAGELLKSHPGGLPPELVLEIVGAVAEALDYAHDRHLLHRDVKPSNILIAESSDQRRILLADFGIARRDDDNDGLTATNMTVGTVAYAAPEQLMGRALDGRADQYALAATAFHLLTGTPPFHDPNQAVVISKHLTAAPPKVGDRQPGLAHLDPALSRAMSKDPADRFARCVDFARALGHGLGAPAGATDETRLSRVAAPPGSHRRRISRARVLIPAALAAVVVVVGAYVIGQSAGDRKATSQDSAATSAGPRTTAATPATVTDTVTDTATATETPTDTETVTDTPGTQTSVSAPVAVAIGAECTVPGATGSTADGVAAYCANLQYTTRYLWSMSPGEIPNPVLSTSPAVPPPDEDESPVQVCMQQTGHTRLRCVRDVLRGDAP